MTNSQRSNLGQVKYSRVVYTYLVLVGFLAIAPLYVFTQGNAKKFEKLEREVREDFGKSVAKFKPLTVKPTRPGCPRLPLQIESRSNWTQVMTALKIRRRFQSRPTGQLYSLVTLLE